MRIASVICIVAGALTFAHYVAAQSPLMSGCAVGSNIPYPTPVVYGTSVTLPATSYLDYMSCSFILNLQSTSPPAFDSTLTFSKFQTELNYDFVEVYNGCDPLYPPQRNSSVAPCSLISDFPFQIMRKSGIFRFPPEGSDTPFTLTSSTSLVLILFRSDISVRSNGFSATLAPRSSGDYGPFPNPPEPQTPGNTINIGSDGKPSNPPYPFDVSASLPARVFAITMPAFIPNKFLTIDILTPFMYGYICREPSPGVVPVPSCRSNQYSTSQDFTDPQNNYPVPQQSSYRIKVPVFDRATFYLFLSLIGPPPPPPLGLLRVNLDVFYGDVPTLCPQNLQLDSAFGTIQIPAKLKSDNARCSWFFSSPLANRIFFSATFRPNSCTAIEIMSPSSGQKWLLNGDPAGPWPTSYINTSLPLPDRIRNQNILPLTFANWEGNAVITAYARSWPPCSDSSLFDEKIQLTWQTLFAEDDAAFVRTSENQINLGSNGVFNTTARLINVPPTATNSTGIQFERNFWIQMVAGQTATIIAKDTNTGSPLNRLSSAPIPLIMVANSRIPTTFDNDFHNWPGILSPVRQQLQEALTISAVTDGIYYVSILGGTILYDAAESIEIFVVQGTGSYDNCWDEKMGVIKPKDVYVPAWSEGSPLNVLSFQIGLPARCRWKFIAPQGTRIAIRSKSQSWGTQLNVWDGVSVLDNRMTSSNKQSPAPGGSWDTLFLVSSSNYLLIEADQQAKAFNQGFSIEYRFVSHAETWAKSPKQRFVAGGPPAQNNIIGAGVRAQLSDWPYFSSLFYVCPQSEAISPGAAITININQIDYSVKLFADLGDTNSTYNSHRAYSFSDKIFTAGFSSVMLKVADRGADGCFDISTFATTEFLGAPGATQPRAYSSIRVSGRIVSNSEVPTSWEVSGLPVLGECKAVSYTPSIDYSTPNIVGIQKFMFNTNGRKSYRIVMSGSLSGRLQSLSLRQGLPFSSSSSSPVPINKYNWELSTGMLYSSAGAYIGRVELPETNSTFYGALTIPQQHSTASVTSSPVSIIAIPTTVEEYPLLVPSKITQCDTKADKFCNANFTSNLCIGWGLPSVNFRFEVPIDPADQHDFSFEFLSLGAAGTVTVLARCDAPPTPSQFDKTLLALPKVPSKLYIPNVCVNTTKQSTVYVSLLSSASPSLTGPTQDAAGILAVTVIATETLEALQQQLIAAEAAASKALPQWATALIVIFALIAVVATIVVGFFLKRARNALETLQSKAETVMDNRHKKYGQLEDDEVAADAPRRAREQELGEVRTDA